MVLSAHLAPYTNQEPVYVTGKQVRARPPWLERQFMYLRRYVTLLQSEGRKSQPLGWNPRGR